MVIDNFDGLKRLVCRWCRLTIDRAAKEDAIGYPSIFLIPIPDHVAYCKQCSAYMERKLFDLFPVHEVAGSMENDERYQQLTERVSRSAAEATKYRARRRALRNSVTLIALVALVVLIVVAAVFLWVSP